MSQFISNFLTYNINTEGEVSRILSHFDSNFILNVIRDNLNQRFRYNPIASPNIVNSFEQNFKLIKDNYQTNHDEIDSVRLNTYKEIIDIICQEYKLQFVDYDNLDYYSAAFYLYDFLVSNFNNYMAFFFANFIYRERNSIYDSLDLNNMKKNKDTSTLYGKKLYKDVKLAIISANIDYIVDNMCSYDIILDSILDYIYPDKNIVAYISSIIVPVEDFYKTNYVAMLAGPSRHLFLSNIKFEMHKILAPLVQQGINNLQTPPQEIEDAPQDEELNN